MLRKITPDAKLMSNLAQETRSTTALAKYTGEDRGDLTLYKSADGKRSFLRVTETTPPAEGAKGAATYAHTVYEIFPPVPKAAPVEPTILDPTVK